ncbi:MAG: 16S rRNA processing protein RimM [Chloroflexota bacterium]
MARRQREPREGYIAVGRVLRPWGLRGDVKVESLTDFPERFAPGSTLWVAGERRTVEGSRWRGDTVYLKLSGVNSPDEAERVRGSLLEVPESERRPLPEGEYYEDELLGLTVRTAEGETLGRVTELLNPGPNNVLVVRGERGEVLIPFIEDVIRRVDPAQGVIEIDLVEGLMAERRPARARFRRHRTRRQRRAGQGAV